MDGSNALVAVVPTRGRPQAVPALVEAFHDTCEANTLLVLAVDNDDPQRQEYEAATQKLPPTPMAMVALSGNGGNGMVRALNNVAALFAGADDPAAAVAFLGDDHRPRTVGWDARYLQALAGGAAMVYGNDLIHGEGLPTQIAIRSDVIRALGWMAPPMLRHLYVDNAWKDLGAAAGPGALVYLPDVTVEHLHPIAGKAEYDAGYERVNAPAMYEADRAAYERYRAEQLAADAATIRRVVTHG